jgi:outer membrane protein assembly factor BamB
VEEAHRLTETRPRANPSQPEQLLHTLVNFMRHAGRSTLILFLGFLTLTATTFGQGMISQPAAARHGLTRAWYAQVGSPQVTGRIEYVNYVDGLLLVQSSLGVLTALDAETGRMLWETRVGTREGSSSEPAANSKYIVVLNGSTLFIIDRKDGGIVWKKQVTQAPGAGPAVTETHVFVPMVSGLVEGYDLEVGVRQTPWNYQSTGRVLTPPMTTPLTVSWTTDNGYFYVADPAAAGIKYRLEASGAIHARPAAWSPMLYATSIDGYVYAIEESKGKIRWKEALGEPIYKQPVAVTGAVLVIGEFGGMYCLDPATGQIRWHTPAIQQFVAASPTRIYAADDLGAIAIIDPVSGARLGTLPVSAVTAKHINTRSDRIYLVDGNCLVQCLHEPQLTKPALHIPPVTVQEKRPLPPVKRGDAAADADAPGEAPPAEAPGADAATDNPFAPTGGEPAGDPPAADASDPFAAPSDSAPADADDPFATP